MIERSGIDALADGFRAELGPPVEELNALNVSPERMPVKDLLWSATWLQGEVKRLTAALVEARRDANDARGDYTLARTRADKAEAERDRLRTALEEVAFRSVQRDLAGVARTALDSRPSTTEEGDR